MLDSVGTKKSLEMDSGKQSKDRDRVLYMCSIYKDRRYELTFLSTILIKNTESPLCR